MKTKLLFAPILLLLVIPLWSKAQASSFPPLADRIPGDALIYYGWSGSESVGPAFEDSHWQAFLKASALPQLFSETLPALMEKVGKNDRKTADVMRQITTIGGPLWRHPSALYFGGIDFNGPPTPRLAVLCDAGTEADALVASLNELAAMEPAAAPPVVVKKYDSLVVIAMGTPAGIDMMFAKPPANSLSKAAAFTTATNEVQHDANAVLTSFIDVQGIVALADDTVAKVNNPTVTTQWPKIRDALGLTQFNQIAGSQGFDGKDWMGHAFIGTNGGKTGLAGLFSSVPLSDDLLSVVPQSADRMAAGHFDLGSLVREVRSGIEQFDPGLAQQFDDGITRVNVMLGLDVQKDILDPLGDEWVIYSDRNVAGSGLLGTVVVNKLKNPDHTDAALAQLAKRANAAIARQMHDNKMSIEFRESKVGDLTIHSLAVPFVSPSWAVKDGNLYLGLYPQVISAAHDQVASKSPSILQSPAYLAVQKRLGDHKPSGVTFLDLPQTGSEGYTEVLAVAQLYLGMADIFGVHPPAMVLPPLNKIIPHLAPSGGTAWTDAKGWHYNSVTPFPGADAFAGGNLGSTVAVGEMSIMASILLPSLNRARETANRVKCASNERQIGQAILLYANENKGNYPPDLGTLVKTEDITPEAFICPTRDSAVPAEVAAMTLDQKAAWVNENSDYVFVGKGLTSNAPPDKVVLYEKEDAHDGDGMNFLYGDGHVEFQNAAAAKQEIEKLDQKGGGL